MRLIDNLKCKTVYLFIMFVILLLFVGNGKIYAAGAVNLNGTCTLTLETPEAFSDALASEVIEVRLYRVADISNQGTYEDIDEYTAIGLSELLATDDAQTFAEKAADAAEYLGVETWEDVPAIWPDVEISIVDNSGTVTDLEPGLYLVCVKPITTDTAVYDALPYLVSMPSLMASTDTESYGSMEWIAELTVKLKLGRNLITEDSETEPETEPESESESETEPESDTESESESESEPESESETEPESDPETESGSGSETDSEPLTESETESNGTRIVSWITKTGDAAVYGYLLILAVAIVCVWTGCKRQKS